MDDLIASVVDLTRRLIAEPSPSGHEEAAIQVARKAMTELGFDQVWVDQAGNLVGKIEGISDQGGVLFDAHLDTVGPGEERLWSYDPHGGEVVDGKIYGRGSSDMKGALAAMLHGISSLRQQGVRPRTPIYVTASLLEEVTEGLALEPVLDQVRPGVVVIGEATDLCLNLGGRGRAEILLESTGRSAHSSQPHLGINALAQLARAVVQLEHLDWAHDDRVGDAISVPTDIWSRPFPSRSVLPDYAGALIDRRLVPGESPDSVIQDLVNQLKAAGLPINEPGSEPQAGTIQVGIRSEDVKTYTGLVLSGEKFAPAWILDPQSPAAVAAAQAMRDVGLPASTGYFKFCTNGSTTAGKLGIPTIGFGPGTEDQAHTEDEWISVHALGQAALGYRALAHRLSDL